VRTPASVKRAWTGRLGREGGKKILIRYSWDRSKRCRQVDVADGSGAHAGITLPELLAWECAAAGATLDREATECSS
jgi:hypothetical protein